MKYTLHSLMILTFAAGALCAQAGPTDEKPKEKPGYKVGNQVQDFTLKNLEGQEKSLKGLGKDKKFVVIDFWSPKCPACVAEEPRFVALHKKWNEKGVQVLHIAPNKGDNSTEQGLEGIKAGLKEHGVEFPALLDIDNKIADAFGAAVTPTVFIIDTADLKVRYTGAVASSNRRSKEPPTNYVDDALTALLEGKDPAVTSTVPSG